VSDFTIDSIQGQTVALAKRVILRVKISHQVTSRLLSHGGRLSTPGGETAAFLFQEGSNAGIGDETLFVTNGMPIANLRCLPPY
jgi:hypothetical protein